MDMNTEITERDVKELRLRKEIAELEKQSDEALHTFHSMYSETPEYRHYLELRHKIRSLLREVKMYE